MTTQTKIKNLNQVDIVFIIDTTSSMGPYIEEAKNRARDILKTFQSNQGLDIKVGLIEYRDHPPQDVTFITREYPFTNVQNIQTVLDQLFPHGGGDMQEAVWPAIDKLSIFNWRKDSDRQVFIILDSPPHGYGPMDGFPQGDPSGLTQQDMIRLLNNLNIEFNAHSIANNSYTTSAIKPLVDATNGKLSIGKTPQDGTTLYTSKLGEVYDNIRASASFYSDVIQAHGSYTVENANSYGTSKGMSTGAIMSNINYLHKRGIKTEDEQESHG